MRAFFTGITYLFHPFFLPMLGIIIMFEMPTTPASFKRIDALYHYDAPIKWQLYVILGVLTFAAPALSMLIMYWNKMISSLHLENKRERVYPFVLVTFYYGLAYFFLRYRMQVELQHEALMGFLFGIILTFIISFMLNFYVKVSLHAAGTFGVAATILAYNQSQIESSMWPVYALIIAGGFVAASRLYLKAHNLQETVLGMLVGFGVLYVCVANGVYI
ncbi:MAG: phosphatase PAP2 family protein [Crocinitomicaceae bacterium]